MAEHLFKDKFKVIRLDPDGKKFDKVTRIEAHSENEMYMQLDVATEVYPMLVGDTFNMVLALTLNLDGSTDTGYYTQAGRKTLADDYDYIMHGKLYKISEDSTKDSNGDSSTKIGERTTTILKHLSPVPMPDSKRMITFANRDDYISFRHHVYEKPGGPKSIDLKEVGPWFELRLYQVTQKLFHPVI